MYGARLLCVSGLSLAMVLSRASAQPFEFLSSAQPSRGTELIHLTLEDLGKINVTSVSRKSESLSSAAAEIHVITSEEIRRSGVTLLPEALRMAPGLHVARPNSRQWAISSRGFNDTFTNKLLVLVDGRTIYTPLFSGVFWEETDTVLEDVDRIEVIRGPGAALWGANAVNGVINVITKTAKETQGTLISGGGGLEERGFGAVRYGGAVGTNTYYRVYGKYANHDEFNLRDGGGGADDNWWMSQTGFRLDWEPQEHNRLTLQGDYYYADLGARFFMHSLTPPRLTPTSRRAKAEGANILGRWTHEFSAESDISVQMYYDRTDRESGVGREFRNTVDFDAHHRFQLSARQEMVWGGGCRYSIDELIESPDFQMRDPRAGLQLFNVFVQDEIAVVPDRLHFTLGTKLQHNDFTGLEFQPSGRIAWMPHLNHTVWGAVSRAVRTPSRTERDVSIFIDPGTVLPPLPFPALVSIRGNPNFRSEDLIAYEIGYPLKLHPKLSLEFAGFYNDYDHLRGVVELPVEMRLSPAPYLYVSATFGNKLSGQTLGGEVTATWQPADVWRMSGGYSYLEMSLDAGGATPSVTESIEEGGIPHHQLFLRFETDLGRRIEWGIGLRYVDTLRTQTVDAYAELDTRLAWKPPDPRVNFNL